MSAVTERALLARALGVAIWFMYRHEPALAGNYLDHMVDSGFLTVEQSLQLMDELAKQTKENG